MDNAGDWLYIVFLIIAGISSLFGSKNKKKRPKQILGQPDREIVTNEDNVPDKGFWEILEEMQNPKPVKQPVPTPKRKKKQQQVADPSPFLAAEKVTDKQSLPAIALSFPQPKRKSHLRISSSTMPPN